MSHLRNEGDVCHAKILFLHSKLELTERFDERHALNVSDGAAEFHYADFGGSAALGDGHFGHPLDPFLDRVRYVRYNY